MCESEDKLAHFSRTLASLRSPCGRSNVKVIVFFLTCASVDYFTKLFCETPELRHSAHILGLHGRMKPKQRNSVYAQFCKQDSADDDTRSSAGVTALFCTDLAARGDMRRHSHTQRGGGGD